MSKIERLTSEQEALIPVIRDEWLAHGLSTEPADREEAARGIRDAYREAGLAPALDDPERGTYVRWFFFGAGCFEPAVVDKLFARPPVERQSALGYGSYEDTLNALDAALAPGPFILGSRFSAVDVYVGSQIQWGLMVKGLDPRPSFDRYMQQIAARPALQRLMKGAQSS